MKKIMIALAAAAFAAVSHAATVSWTINGVAEDSVALTSGHVYMFFATSEANAISESAALIDLAGSGSAVFTTAMGSAVWDDTKKATAAGNFSMGTSAALGGYTLPTNAALGLDGNTTYYAYAVIFDTETISDSSNYIVTNYKAVTTAGDSSSLNKSIAIGSQASATWYAVNVPEPTSGLLMLLGMAGLALRRRRA